MTETPQRQIRADHDDRTIVVYQAYPPEIAEPAVAAGTFVPPFRNGRMTWIKPSFLWMMYRSGWATKPGQERVLAVRITRTGFEQALAIACLSHFEAAVHGTEDDWRRQKGNSPVRVQWDPERSPQLDPLPWRSIQIGLSGPAVGSYLGEWITGITDVTETARAAAYAARTGDATAFLPDEPPYPLSDELAVQIGMPAGPLPG